MKKKSTRLFALIGFLITIGAVGAMQYFSTAKKGQVTEEAAEAVGAAANAAIDWTKDRSERTVEVATLLAQTPQVVTIRAQLTMQGASKLSEVCASLPRVRDAMNVLMFDRVRASLRSGEAVDLAIYEGPLKAALNHGSEQPTVDRLRLSLGNATGTDYGCTERSARRGGADTPAPHENAH
jgi:flagellar basal body-associated protein FliL